MAEVIFLLVTGVLLGGYLWWGIRTLPDERWQILAIMPRRKKADGKWSGLNLTWYGLLTANAYAIAVAALFMLIGTIHVPLTGTATLAAMMLAICVPASRLVARAVEKKAHTFTVGGAVFVGVLLAPWLVLLVNRSLGEELSFHIAPGAALAAFAIAHAFGEGLGRLACLSFGCCYGKPLTEVPVWLRRMLAGASVSFYGNTKKIAYAGGLEGEKVLPVQAITAIIYTCCGLAATFLFLRAWYVGAFILAMTVTQGWRVLSETLRADFRGGGKVSAYQVMGALAIAYGGVSMLLVPDGAPVHPDIYGGLTAIGQPATIFFLQAIWVAIFSYTGRSTVTGATISFHVHQDRI